MRSTARRLRDHRTSRSRRAQVTSTGSDNVGNSSRISFRGSAKPCHACASSGASEDTLVGGLTQISGPERRIPASEFADVWRILNHPADARLMHKTLPSLEERQTNDARWTEALCASTTPLKLVVGTADPTAGRAMAEATNARCNGARRFVKLQLDKAGHFPHLEYAEV